LPVSARVGWGSSTSPGSASTGQWALDTRGPILAAAHGKTLLAFHLG
jgi:hypothetical protein